MLDTRLPGELGELLRHLDSWPYLRIERLADSVFLRMHDLQIGTVNLETRALSVSVPPEEVGSLLERHAQLRDTKAGVSVRVSDVDGRTAAEALLRWRIDLDRFGPQLSAASP